MFERFTRADASRVRAAGAAQGGSTGLGLAIVAAVVEAHHGTVAVEQPCRATPGSPSPLPPLDRHADLASVTD